MIHKVPSSHDSQQEQNCQPRQSCLPRRLAKEGELGFTTSRIFWTSLELEIHISSITLSRGVGKFF